MVLEEEDREKLSKLKGKRFTIKPSNPYTMDIEDKVETSIIGKIEKESHYKLEVDVRFLQDGSGTGFGFRDISGHIKIYKAFPSFKDLLGTGYALVYFTMDEEDGETFIIDKIEFTID